MTMTVNDLAPVRGVTGEYASLDGERYYRIANNQQMPEFFMSLVGASDHWMFISSSGALTAGRCDPDTALFPYASDDQISACRATTGSTTLIRASWLGRSDSESIWEPFSSHDQSDEIRRNLYKRPLGTKVVFEEINETRKLAFRYRWVFSEQYGFVRTCRLQNRGDSLCSIDLLDGLQNLLPYGVSSEFMMRYSNLGNAYKKSELLPESQLALFYLSSIPTDRAEPSEGLKTTTVWQSGLTPQAVLLSTEQVDEFRRGKPLQTETDVRGKAGAFLLNQSLELAPGESIHWQVVAELEQDHTDVINLDHWLQHSSDVTSNVESDIASGEQEFLKIISSSDARQCGANERRSDRHCSNTIFNVMRGGIPLEGYRVDADDFRRHIRGFNKATFGQHQTHLEDLPPVVLITDLLSSIAEAADPDLTRLSLEYLPLAFSRRHGDPTRPWNRFAIRLRTANGKTNLDYQGNWRDIFQNWEALAVSFPKFNTAMICRFVNATTADGYNPYRLTKDGFEWEEPTPDDPWANIGYWGDHQIIYLLRLLESNRRTEPDALQQLLNSRVFVHANVPYRIKNFEQIKQDPQSTIVFDGDLSAEISARVEKLGVDGKLLQNQAGEIHRVTLLDKLLTLSLTKLSNFIPDGGIWLNTQRPEWNDANNALVGNGLSMVTTCYLYRWFHHLENWLAVVTDATFDVSTEVEMFFNQINTTLSTMVDHLPTSAQQDSSTAQRTVASPAQRREITEALGRAGSNYRNRQYEVGPSGEFAQLSRQQCLEFFKTAKRHLKTTILNNHRSDGLFHAYNLLQWGEEGIEIEHLHEMLEGQVAVLSSGLLPPSKAVSLLDALRSSDLYRENQNSYLLYPDRKLPRFLAKNAIEAKDSQSSILLQRLLKDGNEEIVRRDSQGGIHFNGGFRNAADLNAALEALPSEYQADCNAEKSTLNALFISLFGHRQFTGRSGTFFAYEGLGSIYWHMVSKLGLAVVENYFRAIDEDADEITIKSLRKLFGSIQSGIGAEKTPSQYGAFPSDPYSHTPENAGVKQPGMTGQVKEDVLTRFAEIGAHFENGCVRFRLNLFDRDELLDEQAILSLYDIDGKLQTIPVPASGFGFTLCQVPVIYQFGDRETVTIEFADGSKRTIDGLQLDLDTSRQLFLRSGKIKSIVCESETFSRAQ